VYRREWLLGRQYRSDGVADADGDDDIVELAGLTPSLYQVFSRQYRQGRFTVTSTIVSPGAVTDTVALTGL
jgi:hypothetical protein